jgi:hypothetical protein
MSRGRMQTRMKPNWGETHQRMNRWDVEDDNGENRVISNFPSSWANMRNPQNEFKRSHPLLKKMLPIDRACRIRQLYKKIFMDLLILTELFPRKTDRESSALKLV